MKKLFFVILMISLASHSFAASTICKVENPSFVGIRSIEWNDENGTAKMTDNLRTFEGKMTLKRIHSKDGQAVNIYIKFEKPYFGSDEAEYIVFPVAEKKFRVIGVKYIVKEGKRYLNTFEGNYPVSCLSK